MATRLRDVMMRELGELRYEPIEKRIRARLGDRAVIDSTRAMLVWEPKRVVPTYAVPVVDIDAELGPAHRDELDAGPASAPQLLGRPVYDPSVPFTVHSTEGERLTLRGPGGEREAAAFRPSDATLAGYVTVDFDAFDEWYEEDERNVGHPRDPFHRIDIVRSSRHVRVALAGEVLADSTSPCLLFEPPLPVRYYLPPEDVATDRLRPSATRTFCAYKGEASYWGLDGAADIAWSYPEPLREATELTGRFAFLDERVDVVVDGRPQERPVTPWSPR